MDGMGDILVRLAGGDLGEHTPLLFGELGNDLRRRAGLSTRYADRFVIFAESPNSIGAPVQELPRPFCSSRN
jgi:hypothetical protein